MKKVSKNLAMYIMCFSMFVAVFCAMTLKAEAANVTTGTIGDNKGITWTYDADTKTLTITGEDSGLQGKKTSYYHVMESQFKAICGDVKYIIVKDCTIKGSAFAMFADLEYLESVEFSNVNTVNVTDMSWMFSRCDNLNSLDLSKFNTGNVTDMNNMFLNCGKLSSLDISNFNTSKVTDMNSMFYSCNVLNSVDVSNFNTSKVTDMNGMFFDCKKLNGLDVSKFNTDNVTDMSSMFYGCSSLTGLDVGGFNTDNVTNMCYMFYGCRKVPELDVSNFNTSKVTTMRYMFKDCNSLTGLDVSKFNTGNVTSINNMFAYCIKLSSLNLSSFDLTKVTDANEAFTSCLILARIETPKTMPGTLAIDLSNTYVNPKGEQTTKLTTDFCNTTLINADFLVSEIKLNSSSLTVYMGKSGQLTATVSPEKALEKTLTWTSSNTAVAKVDENGKITPVAPGTATITASAIDVGGVSASCSVTVIQPVTGISVNKTSLSLKTGATETLTVTVSPSNASNKAVTWKSSNTSVAAVDSNGKVTAVGPGTATITVTAKDGSGKSASCSVTVTQPVTGITLSKTSTSIKVGGSETLTVTVSPGNASNKAVTWKSSNTSVATVDSSGKVTAVGPGTATITVTAKDGSGKSASCSVTVIQPVTGISLNKTGTSIKVGGSETLTVTVSPSNASNKAVTWKSSNTSVATVDSNGKVTAVAVGTATITATAKDGSGKSASCSVTVIQPVTGIVLNKSSVNLKTGNTYALTATVSPDNATNKTLTWKSSNTAVATVNSSGKITAVGPGTATITATAKDGSGKSASCSVTVTQPVTSVALNKTAATIHLGKSETLTVTVSPDNASNKAVTWKSSNTSVATVDSNGKVTAAATGTATITVTAKDGSGKSASCEVTVIRPVTEVILNKNSVELVTGESETLTATVKPDNASNKTLTWKSSDTTVATVNSSGKITAVAPGTATITATAKDGTGKSASCTIKVISEQEKQVRAFVERMYTIVLGRDADTQGLSDWTARLMAKEIDGATLVDMFVNSDEFIARNTSDEDYIKILYRAVLGREADAEGLKMWKDMLADGWTRDYIMEGLVLSTEFKSICDSYGIIAAFEPTAESQVRSFVKRMYTMILGRRADAVGLNEWTQRLMNGTANGAQLADGFISSDEFVNRNLSNEAYVKVLYRAFFNREADEGGFNVWMNELAKGTSRREVMKGFVHSVEFSDLCAQYGIIRGEMQ